MPLASPWLLARAGSRWFGYHGPELPPAPARGPRPRGWGDGTDVALVEADGTVIASASVRATRLLGTERREGPGRPLAHVLLEFEPDRSGPPQRVATALPLEWPPLRSGLRPTWCRSVALRGRLVADDDGLHLVADAFDEGDRDPDATLDAYATAVVRGDALGALATRTLAPFGLAWLLRRAGLGGYADAKLRELPDDVCRRARAASARFVLPHAPQAASATRAAGTSTTTNATDTGP